jgi:hypothetical protein
MGESSVTDAIPARFTVVGCLTHSCRALWVLPDRHSTETAICPCCGSTHATTRLRPLAQADDRDVARELRARILAERAGQHDAYAEMDDYALLDDQADDYLAQYDGLFDTAVEERITRQTRVQCELFEQTAEDYLNQDDPYQTAATEYLDRRERELDQLVEASGPSINDDSSTALTPFSERAAETVPTAAGLTLTTPDTLPEAVDVRVTEPPIAPTDLWKTLWQDAALHTCLHDALATLTDGTYQSARTTLVDDWGVTAPARTPAPTYAEYLLDGLTQPGHDTWQDCLQVTRQLGGSTPLGQTERTDITNGPIALFAGSDVTPRIAIHLSHEFFEYKRIQRVRFLDFLGELSHGLDIQVVCHGRLAPKKLVHLHNADLPTAAITEAPHPYWRAADRGADSPAAVAETALAELGVDHPALDVLDHLAAESTERREYGALKDDPAFDVSAAAVGKRVRTLIDHRLVSKDRLSTTNVIQLLPAGSVLLDLREQERTAQDPQTDLRTFTDAATGEQSDSMGPNPAGSDDLTDPPNSSHRTVYASAGTEGEDGQACQSQGGDDDGASDEGACLPSGEWLSTAHQTAVQSAVNADNDSIDIALADNPAPQREHTGDYHVGFDEDKQQIIVSVQPSPMAARTMVRLCAALLDPRLRHSLLTPEQLDGPDGEDLGALFETAVSLPVLRNARNMGYLPDRATSGEAYVEELVTGLSSLLADLDDLGEGDDFDPALARSICQEAHGLAGTLTHLYDLLGWTVIRELTFPEYSRHYHARRDIHLQTLATQIAITSGYGHYPMYRVLYEDREDKRATTLGAPSVDAVDPVGECLGSWVLRGPGIDRLASELTDLEARTDLELQDESENFAAFLMDLQIGQATRLASVQRVVTRLCDVKCLCPTRRVTALFYALTGSIYATAQAVSNLAAGNDHLYRDIRLDEVRYALGTLDATSLLPDLDTDDKHSFQKTARSKLLHALLTASQWLSTGELADRAGISTESIRTHRADLESLGLLEINVQGLGKATLYRVRLPFREECDESDAPEPGTLVPPTGETQLRSIRDAIHDLLAARDLLDEASVDPAIEEGLLHWSPSLEPAVERWPWLRPWIDLIARLFGVEGGGSLRGPGEWIDGPYAFESYFGAEPATTQTRFSSEATPG